MERKDLPAMDDVRLDAEERQQVAGRRRASAAVVHETIRAEGEAELLRPARSLFWSGLAAGLAMGLSLMVEGILRAHLPPEDWRILISKIGYTTGFIVVVLGRQQLFTENTLTVVLPALHRPERVVFLRMLRLWGIVLAANVVGTVAFAGVAAHGGIFSDEVRLAFQEVGLEATRHGAAATAAKAVVAGWLIAMMVWLRPEAGSALVLVVAGVTYVVGIADLAHIVAGSVEGFFVVFTGALSFQDFALGFFLPTLAGNVVGGVTLVAVLNHAQVSAEV